MFVAVAFASMDAGAEYTTAMDGGSADFAGSKYLPGMYLRRATAANTEFMSGAIAMSRRTRYVLHWTSQLTSFWDGNVTKPFITSEISLVFATLEIKETFFV